MKLCKWKAGNPVLRKRICFKYPMLVQNQSLYGRSNWAWNLSNYDQMSRKDFSVMKQSSRIYNKCKKYENPINAVCPIPVWTRPVKDSGCALSHVFPNLDATSYLFCGGRRSPIFPWGQLNVSPRGKFWSLNVLYRCLCSMTQIFMYSYLKIQPWIFPMTLDSRSATTGYTLRAEGFHVLLTDSEMNSW